MAQPEDTPPAVPPPQAPPVVVITAHARGKTARREVVLRPDVQSRPGRPPDNRGTKQPKNTTQAEGGSA